MQPRRATHALLGTWPGRILIASAVLKILLALVASARPLPPVLAALGTAASLALIAALAYYVARLVARIKRRLLWRVRRKLILSYIFIGFVPALLIVAFFLFSGFLLFLNVSSYLFKNGVDDLVDDVRAIAQSTVAEIERIGGPDAARAIIQRRFTNNEGRYPMLSIALVRRPPASPGPETVRRPPVASVAAGKWTHLEPPPFLPGWIVKNRGFAGVLAFSTVERAPRIQLAIRVVAVPDADDAPYGVIVDLPIDDGIGARLRESTGIRPMNVAVIDPGDALVRPLRGRVRSMAEAAATQDVSVLRRGMTFIDYTDWVTGQTGRVGVTTEISIGDIYDRMSSAQSRFGNTTIGDVFLVVLVALAILFLIIEAVALVMGFALAKSITGSVHELFEGTEHVRQGDFTHRIQVFTRDQLGELAESFNAMTGSIEDLLLQAAEKKRLEEELRIARQIQMSLLPSGPLAMPGLGVTALCIPAREVGGDYYDFFPLADRRVGILIADVSGKGTSAAFYMAELKGLVLSLSQIYESPKQLLIEANRILAGSLDNRSFITMTYAVVDLDARTFTYARAGHTPLIYLPSPCNGASRARVLAPDGMVVGLKIDGIAERFASLLDEVTIPISGGDIFVLYTDGITEAMNEEAELFGELRLSQLVEEHAHLSCEELRERILREVEAFVGGADQHDDMTMILMKVEDLGVQPVTDAEAAVALSSLA
jgi:sigma-B regulation protein RsbU (phosphoserine phosphatase)